MTSSIQGLAQGVRRSTGKTPQTDFNAAVAAALAAMIVGGGAGPGVVFVNKGGNDATGSCGTPNAFLTIAAALADAVTRAITSLIVIVGPGTYVQAPTLLIPDEIIRLAIVGQGTASQTAITGGNDTQPPVAALPASSAPQRLLFRNIGVRATGDPLCSAGFTVTPSVGTAYNAEDAIQIIDCDFAPIVIQRVGGVQLRNVTMSDAPAGNKDLQISNVTNVQIDGLKTGELKLSYDFTAPEPIDGRGVMVVRGAQLEKLNLLKQVIAVVDSETDVKGNAGGEFIVGQLETAGTHNPCVKLACSAGSPKAAEIATDANAVCVLTFTGAWAAGEAWGADLSGARLYGHVEVNLPNIAAADPDQNLDRHRIGGNGVYFGAQLKILGTAEGGGNKPIRVVLRGASPCWTEGPPAPTLDINGHIDLDARGCELADWSNSFSNGARLDADARAVSVAPLAAGAVAISPEFPDYVGSAYAVALELSDKGAGAVGVSGKTNAAFTLDPTAAAGNALAVLLRPSVR